MRNKWSEQLGSWRSLWKVALHLPLIRAIGVAILVLGSLSACAVNRQSAEITPGADLSKLKSFYVVKFEPDGRGINSLIADRLTMMGFPATTGPENGKPEIADA